MRFGNGISAVTSLCLCDEASTGGEDHCYQTLHRTRLLAISKPSLVLYFVWQESVQVRVLVHCIPPCSFGGCFIRAFSSNIWRWRWRCVSGEDGGGRAERGLAPLRGRGRGRGTFGNSIRASTSESQVAQLLRQHVSAMHPDITAPNQPHPRLREPCPHMSSWKLCAWVLLRFSCTVVPMLQQKRADESSQPRLRCMQLCFMWVGVHLYPLLQWTTADAPPSIWCGPNPPQY